MPAAYRKALGLEVGDDVVVVLDEESVRIMSIAQAVARARRLLGRYVPRGRSLSRELQRERRNEAKRE